MPDEQAAELNVDDDFVAFQQTLKDLEIEKAKVRVKVADVTLATSIRCRRKTDNVQ